MSNTTFTNRAEALDAAQAILNLKPFTKENKAKFDSLLSLADSLDSSGSDELRSAHVRRIGREATETRTRTRDAEQRAFARYLLAGPDAMPTQELALLRKAEGRDALPGVMTGGAGAYPLSIAGFFTPVGFHDDVLGMLKKTDALFDPDVVTFIPAPRGTAFAYPNFDDTSVSATQVTQGTVSTVAGIGTMGALQFDAAPTWRSGEVIVSMEFDQDSAFDLENLLARIFAVRFRRGIGPNFVNTVLSAAASSGQTVIGDDNQTSPNPATQVGVADLFNLANALDPSYAESDRCGWVMNWKTLLYLLNLRDKNGRRMLPTDRDAAGRLTIFEKPVFVSPSMQDIGHSQKPILFGALDRIIVREVTNSLAIKRFSERYAEFAAVSFEGFWRLDCGLQRTQLSRSPVTYSPSPVLYLQNS